MEIQGRRGEPRTPEPRPRPGLSEALCRQKGCLAEGLAGPGSVGGEEDVLYAF